MDDHEHEKRSEDERLEFTDNSASSGYGNLAANIGTKNLLIIIITMPFVFLVVVMGVIAVFGDKKEETAEVTSGAVRSTPVASVDVSAQGERVVLPVPAMTGQAVDPASAITLPVGARIGAISLDGDRMAVRVDTADQAMIVIYDLTSNQVVQTVPVIEATGSTYSVTPTLPLEEDALSLPSASDDEALDGDKEANADASIPTPRLAFHRRVGRPIKTD